MTTTTKDKPLRLSPATSSLVIDSLGGTTSVGRICEISSAAVAQWRREGIPRARLQYLRERFKDMKIMRTHEVVSF